MPVLLSRLLVMMHGLVDIMRLDRGLGLLIFMVMIRIRKSFYVPATPLERLSY